MQDGCFIPLMVNHGILCLDHQKNCPSAQPRTTICIDEKGLFTQSIILLHVVYTLNHSNF